jgi:hypothetical protein
MGVEHARFEKDVADWLAGVGIAAPLITLHFDGGD